MRAVLRVSVASAMMILAPVVYAQTPFGGRGTIESQELYRAPEVFVLKAVVTKQEGRTVEGVATFWNKEDAMVGGLTYKMELLGKLATPASNDPIVEDNTPIFDSLFSKESFTLIPGEKRDIPFRYIAPSQLPAGDYRLEITVATTRGRTMGWYDVPVSFTGGRSEFIDMRPAHIIVPEYEKPEFEPGSGPNVSVGKQVRITAQVHSATSISAIPVFDIYRFNNAREQVATVRGKTMRIGKEIQLLTIPVTPAKTPGVYVGILSLRDPNTNEQLSNIGEYRYVVRGEDADVLHLRMNADGFQKGNTLRSVIDYAGAADAETVIDGRISVQAVDAQGVAGSMAAQNVKLTDQISSGTSAVTLHRSLDKDFRMVVRITTLDGKELVSSEIPFSFTEDQQKKFGTQRLLSRVILVAGGVLVVIGVAFIWKSQVKGKKKKRISRKSSK
jgi:hypothetical protein